MVQSREDRVFEAVTGGFLGGAVAGYLGGGALNIAGLQNKLLLGAAVGIGVAIVAALVFRYAGDSWSEVMKWLAWGMPASAAFCAVIIGQKELLDWAFGRASAGWAQGGWAALWGGISGAVLLGGYEYLTSRPRHRAQPFSKFNNQQAEEPHE